MDVADLERIWELGGAGLIGLAIAAVALHALGSARARGAARSPAANRRKSGCDAHGAVIAPGGAMGWPFRRRGTESLRIQPSGSGFHVLWRVGETAVAHLVVGEEGVARGLYEWFGGRFGTGAERLATGAEDAIGRKERVLRNVNQRRPVRRRLAIVVEGRGKPRVVELVDGEIRSAARMIDLEEAEELLELLADPPRAEALAAPPPQPRRKAMAGALAAVES